MAMAINKVIVIGNLGANPDDSRSASRGQNVANFSLATTERFTDRNGATSGAHRMASDRGVRTACGYVRAVPEQRPASLRRRSADYPPVRSEGRKRQALPDRNRGPSNPLSRQERGCAHG